MSWSCILDASVAMSWTLNPRQLYAARVLEDLRSRSASVPSLWWLEIGNALLIAERSGSTDPDAASDMWSDLRRLRLITEPVASNVTAAAHLHALAKQHRLTTYDATYLDLAVQYQLPLATLDGPLQRAAAAEGVALYGPESAG